MTPQEPQGHAGSAAAAAPGTLDRVRQIEEELGGDLSPELHPDRSLPLVEYVIAAGKAERLWMEREEEYLESGVVEWKGGWHFTRLMKCHPSLQKLTATQALKKVRSAVSAASRQSPHHHTQPGWAFNEVIGEFLTTTVDEFDAIFVHHWKAVRYLPGETPVTAALRLAERYPLSTIESKDGFLPQYRKLVSVAGWLQYVQRDQNILLPTRLFAQLLGVSPRSVSTYIGIAIDEQLLVRVKKYPPQAKMADEYRFQIDRFRILTNGPS